MMGIRRVIVLLAVFSALAFAGCGAGGSGQPSAAASGSGVPGGSGAGAGSSAAGVIALAWTAPTTNTDGSQLTNLAGYRIHYGTTSGTYTGSVDAGHATSYTVSGLGPGTYYLAVTAYNSAGAESGYSNEVTRTLQ